jgi:hypothetical protein
VELITTLGDDTYHLSQIKTWFQRFKNGDLSCTDHSRPGRTVLNLKSQLEAFLFSQKVANSISYISSTPFSGFKKGERGFSSSEARVNFLGAHG